MKISKDIFTTIIFMYPVVTYLMVLFRRYELHYSHSLGWPANGWPWHASPLPQV